MDSSYAGGWPLGVLHRDSAPAFTDPDLHLTRADTAAAETTLQGIGAGAVEARGGAIAGADAGRPRRPPARGRADPWAAPPLPASIYTYSNRVPPRPVDPGGIAVSSTATAGGGQIGRRRPSATAAQQLADRPAVSEAVPARQ
jgi:hypothetical protein